MTYKIKVDKEKCIGCGSCEAICPEVFMMKGDKASVKKPTTEKISCEQDAESACPTQAISIK